MHSGFYVLASILFCLWLPADAQRYNFSTYTIANGMPSNQVNDVMQDRTGRLWIATMNGASWFDGKHFNRFEQSNPASNNPVKSIYEDKKGNLWMAITRNGVGVFNGLQRKYYTIDNGLLSNNVNAITEDLNGNFWIGTSDGLSKFDGTKFISYTILGGLISNEVTCLKTDSKGNIWIGTSNGISRYDGRFFNNYSIREGLAGSIVYAITEMKDGNMWIGTNEGVSVFDGVKFRNSNIGADLSSTKVTAIIEDYKSNKWISTFGGGISMIENGSLFSLTTEQGLADNFVSCMAEDREGNLWLGTSKGLCRYSGGRFITYTIEDGLNDNRTLTVYNDHLNRTWFGIVNGGINVFKGNTIQTIEATNPLKKSTVWSITQDNEQNYWVGTSNGPVKLSADLQTLSAPVQLLKNKIVYAILANKDSSIWFATDRGIYVYKNNNLRLINRLNGLMNDNVRCLFKDSDGLIWVGTMQGIYFMKGDQAICLNDLIDFPKAPATSISQDPFGNILFTTYDFGLFIFSKTKKTKAFQHLDVTKGLINNRLLTSLCDRNYLWLGTPQGVDRIDWNTYLKREFVNITHFDKSNGFFGVETNACTFDKNGFIWFSTVNGAIKYNPNSGYSKNIVPVVLLNSLNAYMREVNWDQLGYPTDSLTGLPKNPMLKYGFNNLSFVFSGIYFAAPEEVLYRWKLKGFDDYWFPSTNLNIANYSNLPPGQYVFMVAATANGRDWSPTLEFPFQIKAPIWRTNFFYFLYVVAFVLLILIVLKLRTRSLRKAQLFLRQKVNERTQQLREKNMELAKLSIVASETGNAVMIFDQNLNLEWVNEGFTRMTGYSKNEIIKERGNKIQQLTSNDTLDMILNDSILERKSIVYETKTKHKDGHTFWTSSTLTPVFNVHDELKNIVVIDTDITLHKKMETQIRESLDEKGSLLKEIHHRVKNNLQIIISLFNLQSSYVSDKSSHKILKESQDRIRSMALIHERFYQSDGTSKIDFDDYIKRLCETIMQSQGAKPDKIRLTIETEKISLDIDTAVPCGLIINELVSNAIKHAFPTSGGEILVRFRTTQNNEYELTVKDNGTGLPQDVNFANADSLGIQLVNVLSDQIEGKIITENENGFCIKITFKPSLH